MISPVKMMLHMIDKELHPEKHVIDKDFYSVNDIDKVCLICLENEKKSFVSDFMCNGIRRIN